MDFRYWIILILKLWAVIGICYILLMMSVAITNRITKRKRG